MTGFVAIDPRPGNVFQVLSLGGSSYICCTGKVKLAMGVTVIAVWAKTYDPDPGNQVFNQPQGSAGYPLPGTRNWQFKGSGTTADPLHGQYLVPILDPVAHPKQWLYVWALMSDNTYADYDDSEVICDVVGHTDCGDVAP